MQGRIVFFVASRGHHSDIGGIAPGSMPPMSRSLAEEGAAFRAFKIVRGGQFQARASRCLKHDKGCTQLASTAVSLVRV